MKTRHAQIIHPHEKPPRRSEPDALMGFWLALAAIVLGCFVAYCVGVHRGYVQALAVPRVTTSTTDGQ